MLKKNSSMLQRNIMVNRRKNEIMKKKLLEKQIRSNTSLGTRGLDSVSPILIHVEQEKKK